jgi:hypothetical protein
MKLPAISIILGSILLLVCCNHRPKGPMEVVKAHRGADLQKLNEAQAQQLRAAITRLVPNRTYTDLFDFRPTYVWEIVSDEQTLWLLLDVDNSGPHPGSTGIRATLFSESGVFQPASTFWTGHRCYLRRASLENHVKGQHPLLVLETGHGAGVGPNVDKQVYARIGERFDLVRMENSHKKATRNSYYINHFACGPKILKQTATEWEADVLSGDRLKILRALVWLGGTHWDVREGDKPEVFHEPFDQIQLVRTLRAGQKIAARLKTLARSEDPWLREAAELAADPRDHR